MAGGRRGTGGASPPREETARRLVERIADGVLVLDERGVVVFANPSAERMLGRSAATLAGTEFGVPALAGEMAELDIPETGLAIELRVSTADWEGRPVHVASLRDITERRRSERDRARLAALVDASGEAIIGLDPTGRVETWNGGAVALYGYTANEAVGRRIAELTGARPEGEQAAALRRVLGGAVERLDTEERRRDGTPVAVAITDSPIRDREGRVVGVARVARDIRPRKRLERELRFVADHDPLTGLYNRRRLFEELTGAIARSERYAEPAALVVGDVDNFKPVNDALGHQAGDELIKAVASTLATRLRDTDVVARLGGDEFGIVLPHTTLAAARGVAESLRTAVRALGPVVGGRPVRVTMSLGVAAVQPRYGSPDDVLAAADAAMYRAKDLGRDRVASAAADGADEPPAQIVAWSARLRAALEEGRFELHAQPILDLATGAVDRHELLLRMRDDAGMLVPPGAFIHTAERYGLIAEIDRWVLAQALDMLRRRPDGQDALCVNVSRASAAAPELLELVAGEAEQGTLDPARIVFEIHESAAVADLETLREFADGVHDAGAAVALDGFGSGFGSFSYLRDADVDYVKIDGELVRRLPGSERDRVLVRAIVDVTHGMGRRAIAAHVGSAATLRIVREHGADYAQGFHVGRPGPPDW